MYLGCKVIAQGIGDYHDSVLASDKRTLVVRHTYYFAGNQLHQSRQYAVTDTLCLRILVIVIYNTFAGKFSTQCCTDGQNSVYVNYCLLLEHISKCCKECVQLHPCISQQSYELVPGKGVLVLPELQPFAVLQFIENTTARSHKVNAMPIVQQSLDYGFQHLRAAAVVIEKMKTDYFFHLVVICLLFIR